MIIARALEGVLSSSDSALVWLDVSANEVVRAGSGGEELAKLLQRKCNLIHLDLRKNVLQPEHAATIAKCVADQKAKINQKHRKLFQVGLALFSALFFLSASDSNVIMCTCTGRSR